MPDISMCGNKNCPSYKKCYRAQANPGHWQSYSYFKPEDGEQKCKSFLQLMEATNAK